MRSLVNLALVGTLAATLLASAATRVLGQGAGQLGLVLNYASWGDPHYTWSRDRYFLNQPSLVTPLTLPGETATTLTNPNVPTGLIKLSSSSPSSDVCCTDVLTGKTYVDVKPDPKYLNGEWDVGVKIVADTGYYFFNSYSINNKIALTLSKGAARATYTFSTSPPFVVGDPALYTSSVNMSTWNLTVTGPTATVQVPTAPAPQTCPVWWQAIGKTGGCPYNYIPYNDYIFDFAWRGSGGGAAALASPTCSVRVALHLTTNNGNTDPSIASLVNVHFSCAYAMNATASFYKAESECQFTCSSQTGRRRLVTANTTSCNTLSGVHRDACVFDISSYPNSTHFFYHAAMAEHFKNVIHQRTTDGAAAFVAQLASDASSVGAGLVARTALVVAAVAGLAWW